MSTGEWIMSGFLLVSVVMALFAVHFLDKAHNTTISVLEDYHELIGKYEKLFQAYRKDVMDNSLLSHKVTDAFIDGADMLARQYRSLCEIVMDKPLSDETKDRIRQALDESTLEVSKEVDQ